MTFLSKKGWGEKKSFVSFARLTPCLCFLLFSRSLTVSLLLRPFFVNTCKRLQATKLDYYWRSRIWSDFFIRIPICLFQKLSSPLDFDSSECVIAGKRISSRQKYWKTMKPKLSEIALLMSNTTKPPQQQKRYNETFMKSSLFKTLP